MKSLRNRLTIALAGFLVLGIATTGLTIFLAERIKSTIRDQVGDLRQMRNYYSIQTTMRNLYAEYFHVAGTDNFQTATTDSDGEPLTVDITELRRGLDRLLLSLRAEIELEQVAAQGSNSGVVQTIDDVGPGDQEFLAIADQIRVTLDAAETANALIRAGRTTEGLAYLEDALTTGLDQELDPILTRRILEDTATDVREAFNQTQERLAFVESISIAILVALAALLLATILLVIKPYISSMTFLQKQVDNLALGGAINTADDDLQEFSAVHDGLARAAGTQARLRSERDASDQRLSEQTGALREEQEQLRQIDQVRRDFLADVSHELRTPLTVLRGVAEVALRAGTRDPKELEAAMARIVDETGHVTRIVDDLYFIARSHAGVLDLRTDIVDFSAVSAAAAREAKTLAERVEGQIEWHGVSTAVEVEGDEDRLRQLFTILVDNAMKYGGRNPRVEVDQEISDQAIVINVRDHGPGVAEKDLPHVFDRLYRGTSSAKEPGGVGLGLPLAKSIVEGHGGKISLSNAIGGGALAKVSLPIFDAHALEAES